MQKKLSQYFHHRREVRFAYLFGSQATGKSHRLSDVDVAVYMDEKLSKSKRFDLRLAFICEIGSLLHGKTIDVVVLNDADIFLAYQAIYDGKIVDCKDDLKRVCYEARTMSRYFDQQYYYRRHAQLTIERTAKEGIL